MGYFAEPPKQPTLGFEFGEKWEVCKLDEHPFFLKRMEKLPGTKAVDFLCILDKKDLYFIEVKDFRVDPAQIGGEKAKEELAIRVAQKIRDSLACIIRAFRNAEQPERWNSYFGLLGGNHPIKVVFWSEREPPYSKSNMQDSVKKTARLKRKARNSFNKNYFKPKLKWLTGYVHVCSLNDPQGLPDVNVKNLLTFSSS